MPSFTAQEQRIVYIACKSYTVAQRSLQDFNSMAEIRNTAQTCNRNGVSDLPGQLCHQFLWCCARLLHLAVLQQQRLRIKT